MYDLIADYSIGEDFQHTRTRTGEAQLEYSNACPQCIETNSFSFFLRSVRIISHRRRSRKDLIVWKS